MKCEWKIYTVQELIDLSMIEEPKDGNHGNIHPKTSDYVPFGVPFIMANDLVNGKVDYINCAFISEEQANTLKKGFAHPGDVLITHKATIGRTAIVDKTFDTIVLTPQVTYYRVIKGISNLYLKYYFDSSVFQQTFANWAGAGSTRAYLGITAQKKLPIVLPPIETQNKIASILSSLDDKIELNNAINNNLERQVSALYQSWFEDFDPTNGVCPDNWSNQMLSTIADISSGKRPPIKSEIYSQETLISIVGAASVMGFTSEANHTDKILVTGRVGTHGVIQRFNTPCWTSDNTLVITSPFYEFTNQILHRIDYSSMNRGSTQPLITQGDMKKVVVLVPDEETLAKFEALAGSLMAQWEANNNENVKLASLRDTLLPKLMSGELDVSDTEI